MKRLLIFILLTVLSLAGSASAQSRKHKKIPPAEVRVVGVPNTLVDSVKLDGMYLEGHAALVAKSAGTAQVDTMLWGGADGSSILSFLAHYAGARGKYVIGLASGSINQVAFNMIPMSKEQALTAYARAKSEYTASLGSEQEVLQDGIRSTTWLGRKQQLSIQTKDDEAFFSIQLNYAPPPKTQESNAPKKWWEK